jgi:hypothetical protein
MSRSARHLRVACAARLCAFSLTALLTPLIQATATADAVTDWNARAGAAAVAACISPADDPLHESRLYAMMHIAVHDALNTIERRSRPYAYSAQVPTASPDAAVAAAARDVLVAEISRIPAPFPPACLAAGIASAEASYTAALAVITDGPAKDEGIQLGQAAAAAILGRRANDGSDTPLIVTGFPQGTSPGEHRYSPGFNFEFAPGWANVTPFVLERAAQFRSDPPYKVRSKKYAADLNEIKLLGGNGTTTPSERTPEQTEIGLFWVESSPLAWNRLARTVSASQGLDLWENARLFGLLNMAMADGYIGSWETKYHYLFWRPVVAIREADNDGNPATGGDPAWTPLVTTPPLPDYDSAHSVEGGAAAEVLRQFFGTDDISFSACSLSLLDADTRCGETGEIWRHFSSFTQAATENAESRILIGFHFRDAVEKGVRHGRKIGNRAVNLFMRPLHD